MRTLSNNEHTTVKNLLLKFSKNELLELLKNNIPNLNKNISYAFYYSLPDDKNIIFGFVPYLTENSTSYENIFEQQTGTVLGYYSYNYIKNNNDILNKIISNLRTY